jgi:hypothetical protein
MSPTDSFRKQHLEFLPNQFFSLVAKELLGLLIHKDEGALSIDDDHGIRRGIKQGLRGMFLRSFERDNLP